MVKVALESEKLSFEREKYAKELEERNKNRKKR